MLLQVTRKKATGADNWYSSGVACQLEKEVLDLSM